MEPPPATWWQRVADRLARYAWLVLLSAVALALAGGALYAAGWLSATDTVRVDLPCANPPCFGGGGLPGLSSLPMILPMLGHGLAMVLGLPSLLAGMVDVLRARWTAGGCSHTLGRYWSSSAQKLSHTS